MSRAPFAYPLGRPLDGEAGGAADLQTDIMRFMAILALCLMAIFALVQSLPNAPAQAEADAATSITEAEAAEPVSAEPPAESMTVALTRPPEPTVAKTAEPFALTRRPSTPEASPLRSAPVSREIAMPAPTTPEETEGFTLRFESDIALSRLVATGKVGFFALDDTGAQRMSVAASRISFWAAPMPGRYHEMDAATVPAAVRDALARTGRAGTVRRWAVTLPTRLSGELERLMQAHSGGALVIGKDGSLRREPS